MITKYKYYTKIKHFPANFTVNHLHARYIFISGDIHTFSSALQDTNIILCDILTALFSQVIKIKNNKKVDGSSFCVREFPSIYHFWDHTLPMNLLRFPKKKLIKNCWLESLCEFYNKAVDFFFMDSYINLNKTIKNPYTLL